MENQVAQSFAGTSQGGEMESSRRVLSSGRC